MHVLRCGRFFCARRGQLPAHAMLTTHAPLLPPNPKQEAAAQAALQATVAAGGSADASSATLAAAWGADAAVRR